MRWLKALLAGWALVLSGTAASFDFNSSYYAVYEGPLDIYGCRYVYIVPKYSLLIIASDTPTPIQFMPQTTGFKMSYCGSSIPLSGFTKVSMTANDMASLGATLSSYKLFSGDFNGDGKLDFFLQGDATVRNSMILTDNGAGTPQAYYNFYGAVASSQYPQIVVVDADRNGLSDIVATDANGNTTTFFGSSYGGFGSGGTGSGGSTFSTTFVGAVDGNFRVDENGAATYSVAILAAPGTAGVVPRISLNYSSSGGDGVAGLGWSIGGLSSITRCRQTLAQDNRTAPIGLNADDRFCLDGQRLILTSGTYGGNLSTYRTEIDSYAVVTAYGTTTGNPAYFKVEAKDGSVTYYGDGSEQGANNSAPALNGNGYVLAWAISRSQDSVGNGVRFQYANNIATNEQLINRIDFAYGSAVGNTTNSPTYIQFSYEGRPDSSSGYTNNTKISRTQRLKAIRSYGNNTELRSYNLVYRAPDGTHKQSLVDKLFECIGNNCLSPTSFNWALNKGGFNIGTQVSSVSGAPALSVQTLDINGDGRGDIVYMSRTSPYTLYYQLSTGSGFSAPAAFTTVADGNSNWQVLDFNNDGRQDLMVGSTGQNWKLYLGGASGLTAYGTNGDLGFAYDSKTAVLDINSDGAPDIVTGDTVANFKYRLLSRNKVVNTWTYFFGAAQPIAVNTGAMPALPSNCTYDGKIAVRPKNYMDANGDGRLDVNAIVYGHITGGASYDTCYEYQTILVPDTALSTFSSSGWSPTSKGVALGVSNENSSVDINGDGLADKMLTGANETAIWSGFQLNTGSGFTSPTIVSSCSIPLNNCTSYPAASWSDAMPLSGFDFNGDGYPDMMYPVAGVYNFRLFNTALGTFEAAPVVSALPYQAKSGAIEADQYLPIDIDGDGHVDMLRINNSASGNTITLYRSADAGGVGNRIIGIDNGLGNSATIVYKPLTDTTIYTRNSDANNASLWSTAQTFDVVTPDYVAAQVIGTSPTANASTAGAVNYSATSSQSYKYAGMKFQASGRGSLGFSSVTVTDDQTQVKTVATYRQDFPFIGQLSSTVVSSAGNVVSRSMTSTSSQVTRTGSDGTKYYQVYTTKLVDQTRDPVNGFETGYVVTDTLQPDEWGNVTSYLYAPGIMNTAYGPDHTTVVRQVATYNTLGVTDYDKRYGRLDSTAVVYIRPGTPNIARTTTFTRYGESDGKLRGLIKTESISSADNAPTSITAYAYDIFGNRNRVTQSASGMADRYTSMTYDADGRFVVSRSGDFYNGTTWVPRVIESVISRNSYGQPTEVQGLNGLVIYHGYDALGRETSRGDNTGAYATTEYIRGGMAGAQYCVKNTAATGATNAEYFDALGRTIAKGQAGFDGRWIYSEIEYDNVGRVKRLSAPHYSGDTAYWTTNVYDNFRLQSQTSPAFNGDIATTTYQYGVYYVPVTAITNALGQVRTEARNYAGEITNVADYLGNQVIYTFNAAGQVVQTSNTGTQSGGNVTINTVLEYDQLGRKTKMIDSDKGTWFYKYNGFGELTDQYKVMDVANYTDTLDAAKAASVTMQHTEFSYDRRGRVNTRNEYRSGATLESAATWSYDTAANGIGLPVSDSLGASVGHTYSYDQFGRLSSRMIQNDAPYMENTSYDAYGRVSAQTDAVGSGSGIRNTYNGYGYLQSVVDLATNATVYQVQAMDARGNIAAATMGNGAVMTSIYDAGTGLLGNQTAIVGSGTQQNLTYDWDRLGNQLSRWDRGWSPAGTKNLQQRFCYDGLNRLIKTYIGSLVGSCSMNATDQDQEYDSFGGFTRKGSNTYTYSVARPHQLQSTSDNVSYTYDVTGNMLSDSSGRVLHHTVFDKPDTITYQNNSISLGYDIDRELIKRVDTNTSTGQSSTIYTIGNVQKIVKTDGSYDMKRNIAGVAIWSHHFNSSNVQTGVDKQYLYKDVLGSVVAVTDQAGVVVQQFAYDPWGKRVAANDWTSGLSSSTFLPVSSQPTTAGFTGHDMLDAVGLIHMRGRVYDSRLGRFLEADPVVQNAVDLQSYNRYAYVRNNPLTLMDPTGYSWWSKQWKHAKDSVKSAHRLGVKVADMSMRSFPEAQGMYQTFKILPYPVAEAIVSIGSVWCTGAYAACVAGGTYLNNRAHGMGTTDSAKSAAVSGVSAYAFSAINDVYRQEWTVGRVGWNATVGGVSSELNGGRFADGFKMGLITAGSRYLYNKAMTYDVTWAKGEGVGPGGTLDASGRYVEADGVPFKPNVFGTNTVGLSDPPDFYEDFWKQGGALSSAANDIPGMNSLAKLHDFMQIGLDKMAGGYDSWARAVFNVPAMAPAAIINYAALLDGNIALYQRGN